MDKTTFLGELGLEECDDEDSVDRDEHWEDCTEGDLSDENKDLEDVKLFNILIFHNFLKTCF